MEKGIPGGRDRKKHELSRMCPGCHGRGLHLQKQYVIHERTKLPENSLAFPDFRAIHEHDL
jgi:hypothetical protein